MMGGERWIIDGNYGSTMEMRFCAADLVIFLDINRITCLISAARRTRKKRSDLPEYLDEPKRLTKDFRKWIWSYRKTGRRTVMALNEKYPDKTFLHVRTRRKMKRILMKWQKS